MAGIRVAEFVVALDAHTGIAVSKSAQVETPRRIWSLVDFMLCTDFYLMRIVIAFREPAHKTVVKLRRSHGPV
jgi:hypothetical protein